MALKIVHIITGLEDGGAEAMLYELCKRDKINEVLVFSLMNEGKYGSKLRSMGVVVYCFGFERGVFSPKAFLVLIGLLRREKPDVIQTWLAHADLIGGIAARLAGVRKLVWTIHNSEYRVRTTKRTTRLVVRILAILSHFLPKLIVCCAKSAMASHERLHYDKTKMVVVPNGYDIDRFHIRSGTSITVSARHNLASFGRPVIGMIARFDPQKDHRNFLCAVARLRSEGKIFTTIMAGNGIDEQNAELMGILREHKLEEKVRLLGQVERIEELYGQIDFVVLSSQSEAFPNVVAEAMASGVPCIATDVGDVAELIGQSGWLVPPKNCGALAQAIYGAMSEKEQLLEQRRKWARERIVTTYSATKMVETYQVIYSAL